MYACLVSAGLHGSAFLWGNEVPKKTRVRDTSSIAHEVLLPTVQSNQSNRRELFNKVCRELQVSPS